MIIVPVRLRLVFTTWLLLGATLADAEILYVRPQGTGASQVGRLRSVNANGTNDRAIPLPFPSLLLPTWSHDGARFALTGVDPQRPGQVTLNAFVVNPVTGAYQNVTKFRDKVTEEEYNYVYALYKAFSPDRKLMAVNSVYRSGTDEAHETGTPALQIFATNGGDDSLALVHVGSIRDNVHHDGEGVDWSPNANIIVAPVKWDAPLESGGAGKGEATALVLAQPVTDGGNARQLTFPRADHIDNGPFGEHILWAEQDYAPKFSPGGKLVAYVRSYQAVSSQRGTPDANIESLRIVNIKTGRDVKVKQFKPGRYITAIDWSPDGTKLVFDLGQQATTPEGAFLQGVQPETDRLFIINTDGTGLRQLRGAPSGTPAWRPVNVAAFSNFVEAAAGPITCETITRLATVPATNVSSER
ncbi:MAG: TolB family protein [Chthoniobacterales bacterium]